MFFFILEPYITQIIHLVYLPRYAACKSGNTTEKSWAIFSWDFFIHPVKYFYEYIMNQKYFFGLLTISFGEIYHQVEHILPDSISYDIQEYSS